MINRCIATKRNSRAHFVHSVASHCVYVSEDISKNEHCALLLRRQAALAIIKAAIGDRQTLLSKHRSPLPTDRIACGAESDEHLEYNLLPYFVFPTHKKLLQAVTYCF